MDITPVTNVANDINNFVNDTQTQAQNFGSFFSSSQGTSHTYEAIQSYYLKYDLARTSLFEVIINDPNVKLSDSKTTVDTTNDNTFSGYGTGSYKINENGDHVFIPDDKVSHPYAFVDTTLNGVNKFNPSINSQVNSLRFACENAEIPGRSFSNIAQKIYGINEQYPFLSIYNDVTFMFYIRDSDFYEKKFFDSWFEKINPRDTYDFSYKDEYSTNIQINQFDVKGDLLYQITLIEAFPYVMGHLLLNWNYSDFHRLPITFTYRDYKIESVQRDNSQYKPVINPIGQLIGTGIKAYSVGSTLVNAAKTKNPFLATSILPTLGMTNITLSSLANKIGVK